MTSQKNGTSALGLQRILGFGSYQTAWTLLHKLRRATYLTNGLWAAQTTNSTTNCVTAVNRIALLT